MLNQNLELCMINGCKSNKIIKIIIITNKIINNNEKIENFYFSSY